MKKAVFIFSLFLLALTMSAQRTKRTVVKTKPTTSAPGLKLFRSMIPTTAKVMFIDSVVVEKNDFLKYIPINSESGFIGVLDANNDFANQLAYYQNELGDRRIIASGDSAKSELISQTKLGDKWNSGNVISDISQDLYTLQNYPFLSADGVTLYFSAEGSESMGGRDIFMSSFDSDNATWYKPQNIGLPYNSTANDYLLAIDDLDTLGWLVTDRRQPADKVCIYTFVPTETRQNFDDDDLDDTEILPYARITSIRNTWKFGNYESAIARRNNMIRRLQSKSRATNGMRFVIDDNTIYTSQSQFKSSESRKLFNQISEIRKLHATTINDIDKARKSYHDGNRSSANTIKKLERQEEQQLNDIHSLEKKIRQIELNNVPSRR